LDTELVWNGNWAWSLPLIVIIVIFHVLGMVFIHDKVIAVVQSAQRRRGVRVLFPFLMGLTTLLATILHILEAAIWAALYWVLGALPNGKSALLYSLGAMTTYGHEPFYLAPHWRLMGALEALNGMILFGLTTAFLYATFRQLLPAVNRGPGT
jgi:hypothetical protein